MIKGKQTAALQTSAHCMMAGTGNHQNGMKWPLIQAVNNHDRSEVERLINDEGVDVNEADAQGNTALLCAVQSNVDLDIIKALVERGGAKVNAKDRCGRTSLFYAVTKSTETASYLFKNEDYFSNDSVVSSILSFFIESLCTIIHDSHPTIDEVLPLLKAKGRTPEVFAKSIVNILLCKIPLLLTSAIDGHQPRNSQHPMFHLHGKRESFLEILKEVSGCDYLEKYQRKESIKKVLEMIEYKRSISDILHLLKEHGPDPNFADSDGNTALHYAACLPWMGIPQDTVKEIYEKLQSFGVPLNKKNHLDQTPLLFCLSGSIAHLEDDVKSTAMKTLVKVCKFLVTRASSLEETTQNGESVFHLVIKLFQQGFEIPDQRVREGVIDETINILHLFKRPKVGKVARESAGNLHNSPLHLWASLVLTTPVQNYTSFVTREHSFEKLLEVILEHLLDCGAKMNGRNKKEETALHLCNTWSAVKLLIHNGAKTNDKDSLERPPLLVAASKKTFLRNPSKEKNRFYPDVQEEAGPFFRAAVEKELDPWKVDKDHKSVLGFLIEFETYDLSKALVEVACELEKISKDKNQKIFVSLLKAICNDKSLRTHWKIELVETVLKCAKEKNILNVVNEPFNVCCETMILQLNETSSSKNGIGEEPDIMVVDGPSTSKNGIGEESDGMVVDELPSNDETDEESDGMVVDDPSTCKNGIVEETEMKKVEEKSEQMKNYGIENTLHCKIAKTLRLYGAELLGTLYETLKKRCKEIDQILKKTQVQALVPWTSISKTHKNVLDKVAKRQECHEIGESICYHKDPAVGSFGADHFVGINMLNSREVAIRRIDAIREKQCTEKLKNLYARLDCEQVIRYLFHLKDNVADRVYIVFELMEGNLDNYFKDAFDPKKGTSLCGDIVKGLNYLHEHEISHFQDHLKPTSIFYKTHPQLCLKITDFDHSQPETSTYVSLSPEVLTKPENHSKSSDMFSCGILLHYILSKGKHPFCPADCTNKRKTDIVSETERNIKKNRKIEKSLSLEATDLSERMLENDSLRRPTGEEVLNHPLFWSKKKKLDLLIAVGNQQEFGFPRARRTLPLTAVETDLETSFGTIVKCADWNDPGYVHIPAIYTKMTKRRRYNTNSIVELVRFIRNAYAHVTDLPKPIPDQLLEDFVFLEYFPDLVMEVYKAVTTYRWDQTREEIKYAMKK